MPTAHKTLAAINDALIRDQGAKFRGLLRHTMPLADDAYSEEESEFRAHLGASIIGRKCSREVWYSFRWTTAKKFDGRMLRLFNRGHLEEPRMVALLLMIGCKVYQYDDNKKQFRISGHKKHYGGSLDAVIVGCPDIPDHPILGEFKTHNDKSFTKLVSEGLLAAKWEHYVAGTDHEAVEWSRAQASGDKNASETSTAGRIQRRTGVPFGGSRLIGSYATIARLLDEMSEIEGLAGVMLTFDDFVIGVEQFGQRIQPLMRCRQNIALAA